MSYHTDQREMWGKGEDAGRSSLVRQLAAEVPISPISDAQVVPPFGPGERGLSIVRESEKHLLQRYVTDVGRPIQSQTWEAVSHEKRSWSEKNGLPLPPFFSCTSLTEYQILNREEWKAELKASLDEEGWRNTRIIGDADPSYNCRSYVFTDGLGGWIYRDVTHILEDNGFRRIEPESARQEDIVIFRAALDTSTHHRNVFQTHEITATHHIVNEIIHAAVVSRMGEHGALYARHKWGRAPLCEQPVELINCMCRESQIQDNQPTKEVNWEVWHTDREGGRVLTKLPEKAPYQYGIPWV